VTQRILFLTRLRDDVDRAEFEKFVHGIELPLVATMPSVRRYTVVRLEGLVEEGNEPMPPYDYADVIEMESVEAYREDLTRLVASEQGKDFEVLWLRYVAEWKSVYGDIIGDAHVTAA
jgi:hypothetical protein